jgi:type III secretion system HrpE/YscL family protein
MSSNIIKARASGNGSSVLRITKESHEASLGAGEILAQAREQASKLLGEAEAEKKKLLAETAERGFASGLSKWADVLADTWKQREDFLAQNEAALVTLSTAIARKVIGKTAQLDPSLVLHTVKESLRSVRGERRITLKVNPKDEALVQEQADSLKLLGHGMGELIIVAHTAIEPGSCVVESELGIIDGQISTQLASIESALLRRFDAGHA